MTVCIEYALNVRLPKLAWFSRIDLVGGNVFVEHGDAVECNDDWMVEGVWDGPYSAGAFHRNSHLFGSGIRLDDGRVHIVSSCALVDRLVYCRDGEQLLVSNSLPLLLARTNARLIPRHDYRVECRAIKNGLYKHDPTFRVDHPRIDHFYQLYYRGLVVEEGRVWMTLDSPPRQFTSFADYRAALVESIEAIVANYRDPKRRFPLADYGTLSNGYDSTTVACLVKDHGIREFFSYRGGWNGETRECDTAPIAAGLGIEPIWLGGSAERIAEDERYMHAANPSGFQPPLLQMATHVARGGRPAVVFTGYHGDIVWGLKPDGNDHSADIIRHDLSGLDLSEVRLKAGFVNVAVPFLFARSAPSIRAISRSREMDPWRLNNDYDRPICRRIVESGGVARHLFGVKKHGILRTPRRPIDEQLRKRYERYLDAAYGMGRTRALARLALDKYTSIGLAKIARAVPPRGPLLPVRQKLFARFREIVDGDSLLPDQVNFCVALYAWSIDELTREIAGEERAREDRWPADSSWRSGRRMTSRTIPD